jgi:hypothetical protein
MRWEVARHVPNGRRDKLAVQCYLVRLDIGQRGWL